LILSESPAHPIGKIIRLSNGELAFTNANDEKTAAKNIWFEYIGEKKDGVKIYWSNLNFRSKEYDYQKVIKELFVQAKSDNIEYFFLPKFGEIEITRFASVVLQTFKAFVDDNPTSNLKLVLIGYEKNVFNSFVNKLKDSEYEPYRERIRVHQNNIADILCNLYFNDTYGPISAVFSPSEGTLSKGIKEIQFSAPTLIKPKTKVDLERLITTCQQIGGDEVGSSMAPGIVLTLARFLSKSPDQPMLTWPVLELVRYELTISHTTRINPIFNQALEGFGGESIIRIPLIDLPGFLEKIQFRSKVKEIPSGIYLILYSTQLKTSKDKYIALSNFLLGPEQNSAGTQNLVFVDFLSNRIAKNPILNAAGITFEREVLETWLKYTNLDPVSLEPSGSDYKFIKKQVTKEQVENVHQALVAQNLDKAGIQNLALTLTTMLESFKKFPDDNLY
jgi:hypothetical protein